MNPRGFIQCYSRSNPSLAVDFSALLEELFFNGGSSLSFPFVMGGVFFTTSSKNLTLLVNALVLFTCSKPHWAELLSNGMATTAGLLFFNLVVLVGPISSHPNLLSTTKATAADHLWSAHKLPYVVRSDQNIWFWKILVRVETIVRQNFTFWFYLVGEFSMDV